MVTPFLLVATAASWFVALKWGGPTLPVALPVFSRMGVGFPRRHESEVVEQTEPISSTPTQEPTQLSIAMNKPAPDLPEVWSPEEEVHIEIRLPDEGGAPLPWHSIEYRDPTGNILDAQTDQQGSFTSSWMAEMLGEYTVSATYGGSQVYETFFALQDFRIVDFREDIVRLYQEFLEWQ